MSDEFAFEVDGQKVAAVAQATGEDALLDAFPAVLLAPTWQALLEGGAIKTPANLDVSRVKVHVLGPKMLQLLVPVKLKSGDEVVNSAVVRINRWSASGDIFQQFDNEAGELNLALQTAYNQEIVDHGGQGQKPHTRA
jgi:hypothetical protein